MAKRTVLFLCTGNSARSQMAEALLRHLAGDRFEALSAGTHPKGVNPLTVQVLEEIGVAPTGLRSKSVAEFAGRTIDDLIVVCGEADRECPAGALTCRRRQFWPFDDPAAATGGLAERLAVFRRVRDEIQKRLSAWLQASGPG
jgi:arsenate reductase